MPYRLFFSEPFGVCWQRGCWHGAACVTVCNCIGCARVRVVTTGGIVPACELCLRVELYRRRRGRERVTRARIYIRGAAAAGLQCSNDARQWCGVQRVLRVQAGKLAAGNRPRAQKAGSVPVCNVEAALPELQADVAALARGAYNVVEYSLPRLHKGAKWYVDFYCMDRGRGCMRRKKYYIKMGMPVRERTKYARELIARLSTLLRCGWNVWSGGGKGMRTYTSLNVLADIYKEHISKSVAAGTLRPSSEVRYLSYLRTFLRWSSEVRREPLAAAYEITREVVIDYLDYLLLDCELSATSRNCYLVWLSSFCGFLADRGYIDGNPCHGIGKLREGAKFREPFTAAQLEQLREYLLRENPHYYLACLLTYYGLIRPLELTYIKVGDISVQEMAITLHGVHTKNGRDAAVAINARIVRHMVSLGVLAAPSHYYLFGPQFRPSEKRVAVQTIRSKFATIRRALRWPMTLQYYSLKDAGIRDLANAEGVVIARDQARHSDISTTNKYIKRHDMQVHDEVKSFKGAL